MCANEALDEGKESDLEGGGELRDSEGGWSIGWVTSSAGCFWRAAVVRTRLFSLSRSGAVNGTRNLET